jgi:hypothetical protein
MIVGHVVAKIAGKTLTVSVKSETLCRLTQNPCRTINPAQLFEELSF